MRALFASAALTAAVALAGCSPDSIAPAGRAMAPLSEQTLALISEKNMDKGSPILVRLFKYGGTSSDAVLIWGDGTDGSRFRIQHQFTDAERGVYLMQIYLFWPASGAQYSRGSVSPILVE